MAARSTILALASLAALTGCEWKSGEQSPPGGAPSGTATPKPDPVIMSERRAAGRWRSEAGILPGDKSLWVIIDIAGSKDLRRERRGLTGRFETVYAQASGKVEISTEGVEAEAPDADGSLRPFRSFTATFPQPSKMLVKSGEQTFLFTYSGA